MSFRDGFVRLKSRYLFRRILEISFVAAGTILLTWSMAGLLAPSSPWRLPLSIGSGLLVFFIRAKHYSLFKLDDSPFIRFLNGRFPELKASADLLLKSEEDLNTLQQLQRQQTLLAFNTLYPQIKFPNQLAGSIGIFSACVLLHFVLSGFSKTNSSTTLKDPNRINETKNQGEDSIFAALSKTDIQVNPPAYTKLPSANAADPNLVFPQGSFITWTVDFTGQPENLRVIYSGRDSIPLAKKSSSFTLKREMKESGFYQFEWRSFGKTFSSDYFKLEMIEDQAPRVTITNLDQYTELLFSDNMEVDVRAHVSDDYGLSGARIVATVSKGSGEGVKFREEKINFSTPAAITGKEIQAATTLSLRKLGLEPGDELYFYAEATDNRSPVPNRHRTETFFISLRDTADQITVADSGLGVDLMPEYFRSQRQIIIDTEKLLREKKKLTQQVFNFTSNELGYDQKVLRLRYGQFLGEEADSGIGKQETDESEEDDTKKFSHQHDTENEQNQVEKKKDDVKEEAEEEEKDPLKSITHHHDDTEEATFFVQSVKDKLKAALTLMWDAELYLRLYEPAKSLPYQYKVLNLLKEISNDSRIYVHRVGFDPPPLKEEKRLSADLSEVRSSLDLYARSARDPYPGIRIAVSVIEEMLETKTTDISDETRAILKRAGNELAGIAIEQPGVFLPGLSLIKSLQDQKVAPADRMTTLLEVRRILWKALPSKTSAPAKRPAIRSGIDEKFISNLEAIKHD